MEHLLDTAQAAEALSLAPITLRKWRITGAGPRFVRVGRAVRYRAADLDAWLASRTYLHTAEADAGVA